MDCRPRRKYVPDLPELHQECEGNYRRLRQILPGFEAGAHYRLQFGETVGDGEPGILFSVLTSSRYTSEVDIIQLHPISDWCEAPRMRVRVYHDTRMVEVIGYQGVTRFRATYAYPNDRMRQPDEKSAVNRLLAEWLQLCLELGCATAGVSVQSEL